ncbi:M42 family metallopeptidase [Thalassorhabdus alkalitolerans]|uniref:M42 family metallopeptidase n=1 Tax=Thalassorhabdus alkalitolerans TaxID=2282697 RepID=A0ABW0YLP7_9BACI
MKGNIQTITDYIETLVNIPSPSGYTEEVITRVEELLLNRNVIVTRNRKGGLLVTLPGKDKTRHRMLTAHVDTLGAMVKEVKKDGRLRLTNIGGFRWNAAEGEYCRVITSSDKRYTGTILLHQASVHVYKNAGDIKRDEKNMEVRLDEKVDSKKGTEQLGIQPGDFVAFEPRFEKTASGYIKSRHLDDKASVALLIHLINVIETEGIVLPYTTHFLISNNEEIGYGGNSNISPETEEYLAVDMGAIGDGQTTDEHSVSICAKDSSGPYHFKLRNKLVELAKEHELSYAVDIYPYYGSDASAAIRAGYDIAHGLIGPGIDASHSHERTHTDSLLHTFGLLYYYVQSELAT